MPQSNDIVEREVGDIKLEQLKMMSNVPITEKKEKNMSDNLYTNIPQAFSEKVSPDIDFTDEPVVECDVAIVKNTFVDDSKYMIQVIIQNMIANKL